VVRDDEDEAKDWEPGHDEHEDKEREAEIHEEIAMNQIRNDEVVKHSFFARMPVTVRHIVKD
jgi:hypothetical protein